MGQMTSRKVSPRWRALAWLGIGPQFYGAMPPLSSVPSPRACLRSICRPSSRVASLPVPRHPAFALAVLVGAAGWVALATAMRLPVSTTHAIVGALIGAGVEFAPGAVNWAVVLTNVAGPLLLSVAVVYLASASLSWVRCGRVECV